MKKSLVVASLLFLGASSVLVAAEAGNEWFIGGEFGGMNIKSKTSATVSFGGNSVTESESDTTRATYEAFKVGKYFEYGRVYGSFGIQNEKDDFSSFSLGLGYDYLFKNKSNFTPFLGINASYSKAKIDDADIKEMGLDKPKGFNYGLEAGLLYAMTKNIELEIGLRYMKSNVDKSATDNITFAPFSVSGKVESENITQYYLGLNYKF